MLSAPCFCAGLGENCEIFYSYKKASTNNILIVLFTNLCFIYKFCVKKIPSVAQTLGNSFKEKARMKVRGTLNDGQRADECVVE